MTTVKKVSARLTRTVLAILAVAAVAFVVSLVSSTTPQAHAETPYSVTMHRMYNPYSGEHLYTKDTNERDTLSASGWQYEGKAWTAPSTSFVPVYRLYNPYSGDHHFTKDINEYNALGEIGWNKEGVGWYSDEGEEIPLYRLFNPQATIGTHHYTTDKNEYETLPAHGWKQEDIAWYGVSTYYADIKIKGYGTITVALDKLAAPRTVDNFVTLANRGFYDGLTFHRIIDGFMMQGGCPYGDGTGGSGDYIAGEFSENGYSNPLSHTRGAISMARSDDPNSASSQFFIVHENARDLDGQYASFGYVTSGMDIVDAICTSAKPTDNNGTISKDQQPVIESISIYQK